MYFESRADAGNMLAVKLFEKYRYEDSVVVALSEGSVLLAEQVALEIHCMLTMLIVEDIEVPGESVSFGGVSQSGEFTYNSAFSSGEIDEYTSEFHGYLDEQKREKFQKINRLLGDGGTISKDALRARVVILVQDGISNCFAVDAAMNFLKSIRVQKVVIAAAVASVPAVDQLHILADDLEILDVKDNYMGVNHYFEHNDIPSREEAVRKINGAILHWQ